MTFGSIFSSKKCNKSVKEDDMELLRTKHRNEIEALQLATLLKTDSEAHLRLRQQIEMRNMQEKQLKDMLALQDQQANADQVDEVKVAKEAYLFAKKNKKAKILQAKADAARENAAKYQQSALAHATHKLDELKVESVKDELLARVNKMTPEELKSGIASGAIDAIELAIRRSLVEEAPPVELPQQPPAYGDLQMQVPSPHLAESHSTRWQRAPHSSSHRSAQAGLVAFPNCGIGA